MAGGRLLAVVRAWKYRQARDQSMGPGPGVHCLRYASRPGAVVWFHPVGRLVKTQRLLAGRDPAHAGAAATLPSG